MTAKELKQWRERLQLNQTNAAIDLGISRATVARFEAGDPIPKYIDLACKWLEYQWSLVEEITEEDCIKQNKALLREAAKNSKYSDFELQQLLLRRAYAKNRGFNVRPLRPSLEEKVQAYLKRQQESSPS